MEPLLLTEIVHCQALVSCPLVMFVHLREIEPHQLLYYPPCQAGGIQRKKYMPCRPVAKVVLEPETTVFGATWTMLEVVVGEQEKKVEKRVVDKADLS